MRINDKDLTNHVKRCEDVGDKIETIFNKVLEDMGAELNTLIQGQLPKYKCDGLMCYPEEFYINLIWENVNDINGLEDYAASTIKSSLEKQCELFTSEHSSEGFKLYATTRGLSSIPLDKNTKGEQVEGGVYCLLVSFCKLPANSNISSNFIKR